MILLVFDKRVKRKMLLNNRLSKIAVPQPVDAPRCRGDVTCRDTRLNSSFSVIHRPIDCVGWNEKRDEACGTEFIGKSSLDGFNNLTTYRDRNEKTLYNEWGNGLRSANCAGSGFV